MQRQGQGQGQGQRQLASEEVRKTNSASLSPLLSNISLSKITSNQPLSLFSSFALLFIHSSRIIPASGSAENTLPRRKGMPSTTREGPISSARSLPWNGFSLVTPALLKPLHGTKAGDTTKGEAPKPLPF
jgi:hypothetical protein